MAQSLMQHQPADGASYKTSGLNGQKVAIIGYSHWNGDLKKGDSSEFTKGVIEEARSGSPRHNFFEQIFSYFCFALPSVLRTGADLWDNVMFFNYLPRCIGGPEDRFARGKPQDHEEANERFRNLVSRYKPGKALIFSAKAWDSMPPFDEKLNGFNLDRISKAMRPESCGIYNVGDHRVTAFGLRHPQGASKEQMCRAVDRIMKFRKSQT